MTTTTTNDALVKAASQLVPRFAERAAEAERLGRVPDANIEDMAEAGLFGLSTPRSLGGHQASIRTQIGVFSEIARGCASTSWATAVYAVVGYFVCAFPDEAQDEFFSSDTPLGAGVFSANATAIRVSDGFRVTGKWPFCTGHHHAGWITVPAQTTGPEGQPDIGLFLVPRGEFSVADDWHVIGLAGTGSNTVSLDDVFVPARRYISFLAAGEGQYSPNRLSDDPYYQAPMSTYTVGVSAGTPLGIGRSLLDRFRERVGQRGITYTRYLRQADAPVTHLQMTEAAMAFDHLQFHTDRLADTIDGRAETGADWDLLTRVRCRADIAWSVKLARKLSDIVQNASGASAIHTGDPLQRVVRDAQTIALHSFLLPTTSAEIYGRVLCGLDPGVDQI